MSSRTRLNERIIANALTYKNEERRSHSSLGRRHTVRSTCESAAYNFTLLAGARYRTGGSRHLEKLTG